MGDLVGQAGGRKGVTSVALTVPAVLSVAGSPITGSGTLAVSLATQNANLVFAGPTSGGAATPSFRSLVVGDIPVLDDTRLANAVVLTPATSTRNVIQPTGAAVIPLIVKGAAGQSANLQEWQDNAAAILSYITSNGYLRVGSGADYIEYDSSGGMRRFVQGSYEIKVANTTTGFVVYKNNAITTPSIILGSQVGQARINHILSGGLNSLTFSALTLTGNLYGVSTSIPAVSIQVYSSSGAAFIDKIKIFNGDAGFVLLNESGGNVGVGVPSPSTKLHVAIDDSATTTVTNLLTLDHTSSGTPAAGFGVGVLFVGESSTTVQRNMGRIRFEWTTATDASRASKMVLSVYNVAAEVDVISIAPTAITLSAANVIVDPSGTGSYYIGANTNQGYFPYRAGSGILNATGSIYINIDANDDDTDIRALFINKNSNNVTGSNLMTIFESGKVSIGGLASATSVLDVNGDIEVPFSNAHYFGDPTTDGSLRLIPSGTNLLVQRRISGVWTTQSTL